MIDDSSLISTAYKAYRKLDRKKSLSRKINTLLDQKKAISGVGALRKILMPLNLKVTNDEKERINFLIPTIDFKYFFGGYIAVFNIAQWLASEGNNVRMIMTEAAEHNPELWKKEIKHFPGLENFFDLVEVIDATNRKKMVFGNPKDVFIATSWLTSHIANDALKKIKRKKYIFLIQEYEPFFTEHGTLYALANEAYQFPHYAIFSSEFLKKYFKQNKIGVFNEDIKRGENNSISFENAIIKLKTNKKNLEKRKKRKLLFYARPEKHAARNMYELGVLALSNAIKNGCFDLTKWDFHGIGSISSSFNLKLHDKTELKLQKRTTLDGYKKLLPNYDIGISLMLTPHPNLVTLEMASAGMIVVTNNYANKTRDALSKISQNIITAEPTLSSLEEALFEAVKRIDDYDGRIRGSKVSWSTSWKDTFDSAMKEKIIEFLKNC